MSSMCWDSFLRDGDELYEYLTKHFEDLFDGNKIKHLTILDEYYPNIIDLNTFIQGHLQNIEKELTPWIRNELEENRLFDKSLWKPFRNYKRFEYMYYGYRKLFKYKNYYLQIAMKSDCELDECIYCDQLCESSIYYNYDIPINHFDLVLYGWKDDTSDMLQPRNKLIIPCDNMMEESDWIKQ
jgi:hypothetical protein